MRDVHGEIDRLSLFLRSLRAMRSAERLATLDLPWWCFAAIQRVERFLDARRGTAVAFEYGPGASTLWLSRRCRRVSYVEHDAGWGEHLRALTASAGNIEGRIVTPRPAMPSSKAVSRRWGWRGLDFAEYVAAIGDAGGPFDLIVIDGRARPACLDEAPRHLRADGMILLDNAGRRAYGPALRASDLAIRRFRGLTPAAPYPTTAALLARDPDLLSTLD